MHLALLSKAFDDLQVGVGAGAFDSKIHIGPFLSSTEMAPLLLECNGKTRERHQNLALHFEVEKVEPSKNGQFQKISASKPDFTVEDGFGGVDPRRPTVWLAFPRMS
jgi:hypothetical protein